MALKQGNGLQGWEIAVTKKLIGEFRRRSRSLYREEFDDLLQECLMHWLEVRQQLPSPRSTATNAFATDWPRQPAAVTKPLKKLRQAGSMNSQMHGTAR
jgi:hypothetical protein